MGIHNQLLDRIRTPFKLGRHVLLPSYCPGEYDSHVVDCPFLFSHGGCYWMTFIGWDAFGYQTGLARSDDLIHWEKQGIIFGRGPAGSITEYNAALTCILRDNDLFGSGTLRRIGGRYIGTYHAYPKPGYEAGPGAIGLCFSDDLRKWDVAEPVLRPNPLCSWESGGLYKSWLLESNGTYYLFYNARDKKDKSHGPWKEETGVAFSTDLQKWERYGGNPVVRVGSAGRFDDRFASDPCVLRHGDTWIMFYFGNSTDGHARDGFAFSGDLLRWQKGNEVLVDIGPHGSIDSKHAAKPGIIARDGYLYHFYGAVSPWDNRSTSGVVHSEVRGIALASNDPRHAQAARE